LFSPDGAMLALARGPTVFLYESATGKVRREFSGHRAPITAMTFSPDGSILATGSADTTILLWDVRGQLLPNLKAKLDDSALEQLWSELSVDDAGGTFRAIRQLAVV